MTANATFTALLPKRSWTPIAWIDVGIRAIALVILVTAGLLNAQAKDSPGHAHIERAKVHLRQARSALATPQTPGSSQQPPSS